MAAIMRTSTFTDLLLPSRKSSPVFQHPQQFGLQFGRHLAHLIQEKGAFMGFLKHPFAVFGGAGERAGGNSKHLAFQKLFGEGSTVNTYKRLSCPTALLVYGTGKDFPFPCRFRR